MSGQRVTAERLSRMWQTVNGGGVGGFERFVAALNTELDAQQGAGEKCDRCDGDGKAHGSDRPFEWSGPGTYPGPCPRCGGSGKNDLAKRHRDTLGLLERCYTIFHREGWEDGENAAEVAREIHAVLCNEDRDPSTPPPPAVAPAVAVGQVWRKGEWECWITSEDMLHDFGVDWFCNGEERDGNYIQQATLAALLSDWSLDDPAKREEK